MNAVSSTMMIYTMVNSNKNSKEIGCNAQDIKVNNDMQTIYR